MAGITLQLEESHQGLVSQNQDNASEGRVTLEENLVDNQKSKSVVSKKTLPNFSKNNGYYIAARFSSRMLAMALSLLLSDTEKLSQIFTIFTSISLILIFFIIIYFKELKVT